MALSVMSSGKSTWTDTGFYWPVKIWCIKTATDEENNPHKGVSSCLCPMKYQINLKMVCFKVRLILPNTVIKSDVSLDSSKGCISTLNLWNTLLLDCLYCPVYVHKHLDTKVAATVILGLFLIISATWWTKDARYSFKSLSCILTIGLWWFSANANCCREFSSDVIC